MHRGTDPVCTGTPSLGMVITINPEWDGEQSYGY